jgi:hypothetical protein
MSLEEKYKQLKFLAACWVSKKTSSDLLETAVLAARESAARACISIAMCDVFLSLAELDKTARAFIAGEQFIAACVLREAYDRLALVSKYAKNESELWLAANFYGPTPLHCAFFDNEQLVQLRDCAQKVGRAIEEEEKRKLNKKERHWVCVIAAQELALVRGWRVPPQGLLWGARRAVPDFFVLKKQRARSIADKSIRRTLKRFGFEDFVPPPDPDVLEAREEFSLRVAEAFSHNARSCWKSALRYCKQNYQQLLHENERALLFFTACCDVTTPRALRSGQQKRLAVFEKKVDKDTRLVWKLNAALREIENETSWESSYARILEEEVPLHQRTDERGWAELDERLPAKNTLPDLVDLSSLSSAEREALLLVYEQQHTYQEAARILGLSLPALKKRIERAKAKLRASAVN